MILKPLVLDGAMQIPRVLCKSPECLNGLEVPYFSGCVPLRGKSEIWLARGYDQSTSSWNLEKEFHDVHQPVRLCPATSR